jgi:hypothetical protein
MKMEQPGTPPASDHAQLGLEIRERTQLLRLSCRAIYGPLGTLRDLEELVALAVPLLALRLQYGTVIRDIARARDRPLRTPRRYTPKPKPTAAPACIDEWE